MFYKIVDIKFEAETKLLYINNMFLVDGACPQNVFGIQESPAILTDNQQIIHFDIPENMKHLILYNQSYLLADKDWKQITIYKKSEEEAKILLLQAFYTHAVQRHIIQLHSSLIDFQGKGILFLGPSGIGKTTQAELWSKYRGAKIINGDIVFVQEKETEFLGWGSPWHGSSPYCENANVPVKALIVLKQAKGNSIRKLEGFEKVKEVSGNVFYPQWLENGIELCLKTLDHLLSGTDVYELSCLPDEDAVNLLEQVVFCNDAKKD